MPQYCITGLSVGMVTEMLMLAEVLLCSSMMVIVLKQSLPDPLHRSELKSQITGVL